MEQIEVVALAGGRPGQGRAESELPPTRELPNPWTAHNGEDAPPRRRAAAPLDSGQEEQGVDAERRTPTTRLRSNSS